MNITSTKNIAFKFILPLLSLLTLTANANTATYCSNLLDNYQIGNYQILGQGAFAKIFKVQIDNTKAITHKIYFQKGGGFPYPATMSGLDIIKQEVEKLKILSGLFTELSSKFKTINIIDIIPTNYLSIKEKNLSNIELSFLAPTLALEYIDGITIEDIFMALVENKFPLKWVDREIAESILTTYNNEVSKIYETLEDSSLNISENYFNTEEFSGYRSFSLDLIVKNNDGSIDSRSSMSISSNNILATKDSRFILIDPI